MGIFKRAKQTKRKKKSLLIKMGVDINDVITKFCEAANLPQQELGYALGRLCDTEDKDTQLSLVMQIYFLAGIYYREEEKDKSFSYEYLTQKEKEKELKDASDQLFNLVDDLHEAKVTKERGPNYIG